MSGMAENAPSRAGYTKAVKSMGVRTQMLYVGDTGLSERNCLSAARYARPAVWRRVLWINDQAVYLPIAEANYAL